MDRDEWQKKFREGFGKIKEKPAKTYEEMTKEEKEKFLRERNKKQTFSGFADGGNVLQNSVNTNDYMEQFKQMLGSQQPSITPSDVQDAQLAQLNEEAKSPSQKTKPELIQDQLQQVSQLTPEGQAIQDRSPAVETPEIDPMLAKYKEAIAKYENKLNAPKEELNWKDNLPDMLAAAHNIINYSTGSQQKNIDTNFRDKIRKQKDESSEKDKTGLQNLQNMYAKYMELQKKGTPKQLSALDQLKIEKLKKEIAGPAAPTFAEKEKIKAEVKDEVAAKKENRETRKETEKVLSNIDEQIKKAKDARDIIAKAAKSKDFGDTGPIDQYINKFTDKGQKIEQAINSVSLDAMTKMFAGMSKAIDSDAERAFFQASQPSVAKYPQANLDILDNTIKNLESLKAKNKGLLNEITPSGVRKEPAPQANEVKRRTKDGRTAIFNADTKEFLRYE